MSNLRNLVVFLFFIGTFLSHGQLAGFNLDVEVSDETCTNNGTLQMSTSNTTAGTSIFYRLYLAPDFTTAIAETGGNTFTSLGASNYRVIATQSSGSVFNMATVNVTIDDLVSVLDFELSDSGATDCDLTAKIIVEVLSGNAVSYEILSGPVTAPLQSSNEFTNLPAGEYLIRVFDDCGDALSKGYTLILSSNSLIIGTPVLPEIYSSCTSVVLLSTITTSSNAILYPLVVNYTVFAPDGSEAQSYSQTISSGSPTALDVMQEVNLFDGQLFSIEIEISDNCNNMVSQVFEIDSNPKLSFEKFDDPCGLPFFTVSVSNYFPPFMLEFTAPAGFNPSQYNAAYPGPYTESTVVFGDEENTVPFGVYNVAVQDGCNRTATLNFTLNKRVVVPRVRAVNNGCDAILGSIRISLPEEGIIVSIVMTEAPAAFSGALPLDVLALVNAAGVYNGVNLPIGDYVFVIVDNCDNELIVEVTVPAFVFGDLTAEARPSCVPIFGTVKLSTSNGKLVTVNITAAPASYATELPQNVSFNINATDGNFYMGELPPGNYTFVATDICGYVQQVSAEIVGYVSNSDGFSINRKCGAFDITINDEDTLITGKTFWLQRLNPLTNTWTHPFTGVNFAEGTIPTSTTATQIANPGTLLNIFLTGDFRIIKVFETFNNGNPSARCADLYAEFIVSAKLLISGVYNLNCSGSGTINDVVLDVIGVAPITYQITEPYFLDNGTNNVFSNLPEGIYNFLATDNCGNIRNISVEIGAILPLAQANTPSNLLKCADGVLQFGTFSLIAQTPQVLGNQDPSKYVVSYYFSQNEANLAINALPDGYTNTTNPQTIFVRIEHKSIKLCYETTSFELIIGTTPVPTPTNAVFVCKGGRVLLTADSGYDGYQWSTGATTPSILVSEAGTYTVTIRNVYGAFSCDASVDFTVVSSEIATILEIETSDWSSDKNTATIRVSGGGSYVYSLDNINFQTSNTFTDLLAGFYTVYVKDENGCGTVEEDFVLLNYPKYFTPNGDGFNDTWQIRFSNFEPKLNADIFDRFGRFIIRLKGGEVGWDGTYNGRDVFSTDYWFVVTREDGKIYKGHFSLKR
jgi:gliding motility-associated-like protein